MKIKRVDIKNFRSIKDIEIVFDPICRVLIGINESGKSNILNALAFLSDDYQPARRNDLREVLPDEDQIEESYVRFVFKFEKNESDQLARSVSSKILAGEKDPNIVSVNGEIQKISKLCTYRNRNEGLYRANIFEETKSFAYWAFGDSYELLSGWKKPTDTCPPDFSVELAGQHYKLADYRLVHATDFSNIPDEYLEDAEIDDLSRVYGQIIRRITEKNLPEALFWKYDESNFLPESVGIAEFSQNPDSCIPLKNMFALANIANIEESLERAREGTSNRFQNYLNNIAEQTTKHFRNVWKEYKNVEFSLNSNDAQIIPGIREKNTYDFARRSDGFKRFVSFLLMISVNVKTDKIRNTLLLVDEPEISLHPSGARYLRDELINISGKNYVVYSTHSIFMIDNENIKRHYIVKKEDEITSVESAKESSVTDEEVLYNALKSSVFSVLKQKNLIFEGWKDKHLFRVALENAGPSLKKKYKDVGTCHAKGVSVVRFVTPIIELANRKCLIVSDSDRPAKSEKKTYEDSKGFGNWKTYQDIDSSIEAITGEDFIKNDFITQQINIVLLDNEIPAFDEADLPDKKNKLSAIRKWLKENAGMTDHQAKNTITEIKDSIFDNLKYENIDLEEYLKLLKGISF